MIKYIRTKCDTKCDTNIYVSDQEFSMISSVVEALSPIKIALEALCRRDTNLITAEATVKFLLEDLHKYKYHYHTRIIDAIDQRIVQESRDSEFVNPEIPGLEF